MGAYGTQRFRPALREETAVLRSFVIDGEGLRKDTPVDELTETLGREGCVVWVDLERPTEEESKVLTDVFKFHPLSVEDSVREPDQPKVDDYVDYLFFVFHAPDLSSLAEEFSTNELNVYLGKSFIVTVHNSGMKCIETVANACENRPQRFAGRSVDFLFHAIVDSMVDNFSPVLSFIDRKVDEMEAEVFDPDEDLLNEIFKVKRDIQNLRRAILPQESIIRNIAVGRLPMVDEEVRVYFRDVYDHLIRITRISESHRVALIDVRETHQSHLSTKMNDVMKTLTIIMTIMMPLTLITGVYGMSEWKHSYFVIIAAMGIIVVAMLAVFKKKKWF